MQRLPTRWTRAQIAQYEAGYEMGEHDARLKATGGTIRPPQSTRPSGDLCPVRLGFDRASNRLTLWREYYVRLNKQKSSLHLH
jgi:hypothetical protein